MSDQTRLLIKRHHPDAGGEAELFHRIQEAWHLFEMANSSGGATTTNT